MKRFEFRLESLMTYKAHLEQMARREMADALAEVNRCEHQIQTLEQERRSAVLRLENLVEKGMSAMTFKRHHGFLSALDQMLADEKQSKRVLVKKMEETRTMLNKRTIEKKALERLREKQSKKYTQEILREEQKQVDEIAGIKTAREIINGQA